MQQIAVFVDAGYLYAQASILLTGRKQPRPLLSLDEGAVVAALTRLALERSEGGRLLRIYWYDGAPFGNPTPDQARIGDLAFVRLRLGLLNSVGEQKGVDALIMTDLMELARNHAIADALLLSGDEDVRMGMHVAQSFGVRVHLLGIAPIRESQSYGLRRDSDTATEWSEDVVRPLVAFREIAPVASTSPLGANPVAEAAVEISPVQTSDEAEGVDQKVPVPASSAPLETVEADSLVVAAPPSAPKVPKDSSLVLQQLAADFASRLSTSDRTWVLEELARNQGIPHFWDRKMLGTARDTLNRELQPWEKRLLREAFVDQLHP